VTVDDDKTPEEPPADGHDAADDPAGEHEAPPPATYAGRKRAESDPPAEGGDAEAAEPEPEEGGSEDLRAGFTEEFDEIERDLDAELAGLAEAEDGGEEPEDDAEEAEPEDDAEEAEPEDEEDATAEGEQAPASGETVEAETVGLADKAEAEDAALAALRARTESKGTAGGGPPPATEAPEKKEAVPAAALAVAGEDEAEADQGKPPRAKRLWARFLTASLLIVISIAAATSISLLAYLTHIADGLRDNDALASVRAQLAEVDGGAPQTILIIGSDKRLNTVGDPGRSDTTILLRVDPDKHAIALLSIPRDLRVNIPGVGVDKFNAAYSAGGPKKTLRVVKQLTGLEVNHVVNINFTGFADAVDAIGCVYIDVDRRYYIAPDTGTAEIDIEAGYQRLCGLKALQYVRFRHEDNDLVRSARQQDFLREARQKLPPGKLISDRNELLDIFTKYTTSDIGEAVPLLELLKTFLAVQSAPVREVHFPAQLGATYVTANDKAVKEAVAQFLNAEGTPGERPAGESPPAQAPDKPSNADKPNGGGNKPDENKPKPPSDHFEGPAMQDSTDEGQTYAHQVSIHKKKDGDPMIDFPVYYPTRLVPGSFISNDTRAFVIDGPDKDVFHGYKMVVDVPGDAFGHGLLDEFYGVSGTDWVDAPILANPSETRTIDGKEYLLFYDGDRLRTVGWKNGKAAYWVNNTLLQSLDEGQMLSIATSMREYQGK
jgi:LCP family protein required for cell wall assembly